jgi:hypothetical protein
VGVTTSSPGPTPAAISAARIASVPDDMPIACATPMRSASARSSPSTTGPLMNRWLSHTASIARSTSGRIRENCADRSRSGTCIGGAPDT